MPVLTCGHGILCKPAETPMDISQMPVCAVIYLKNAGSPPRTPVLLRACVVETLMEASLRGNLKVKCWTPSPDTCFVRACVVETRMDILQELVCAFIY